MRRFIFTGWRFFELRTLSTQGRRLLPRHRQWDKYAISFYLKMCTCFGVDYQHLEEASATSEEKKQQLSPSTKEVSPSKGQEEHMGSTRKMILLEHLPKRIREEDYVDEEILYQLREKAKRRKVGPRKYLRGPFKMGSYSPGTEPDRIPYPLYLLVEEAVEIMKRYNDNHDPILIELKIVEKKIRFFCTYFNSHLPTGWKYNRANASSLIDGYDDTSGYKCLMAGLAGYTPFGDWAEAKGSVEKTSLSPRGIVDVMSIIHSGKTPMFWGMSWQKISFYCKLCSCFGIEYHRLEAAYKEKVCLMNVG